MKAKDRIIQYLIGDNFDPVRLKEAIHELAKTAPEELRQLQQSLLSEDLGECGNVSEVLPYYLALGEDASNQMPGVQLHLQICDRCSVELNALKEVQETQSTWEEISEQIYQNKQTELEQKFLEKLKLTTAGKGDVTIMQPFEIPYSGPFLKIIPEKGRLKITECRNILLLNARAKEEAQDIISATIQIRTESSFFDVNINISLIRNTYHLTLQPSDNADPNLMIYCRLLQTFENGCRDITDQITQQGRESGWNKLILFDKPTELQFFQKEEDLAVDIGFTRMEDGEVKYYCGVFRVEIPKN